MSKIQTQIPATVAETQWNWHEEDLEVTNADAYAASSFAETKTVHESYGTASTVFKLDSPAPDGRSVIACCDKTVFDACQGAAGERCLLGFDGAGKLRQLDIGEVTLRLGKSATILWEFVLIGVAVLVAAVVTFLL
jgi:hypothetical protein